MSVLHLNYTMEVVVYLREPPAPAGGTPLKYFEKTHRKKRIYTGRAVNFRVDDIILPNKKLAKREFIEHPGAVAVLPFIDKEHVVLVRQYRYPVKKMTLEIPAGKIDKGEKPLDCIKREMEEEIGYKAKKIKKLISYWPSTAFSDEMLHIYLAQDLVLTQKTPDEDEFIDHKIVKFDTALNWVKTGRIRDAKTVIALLFWVNNLKK